MILLGTIYEMADKLEYKIYGSDKLFNLRNISVHRDGIYKFTEPKEGSEKDRFMIEYSGNKDTTINNLNFEIAHYILLKEKENSRYLIDVDLFNYLLIKVL